MSADQRPTPATYRPTPATYLAEEHNRYYMCYDSNSKPTIDRPIKMETRCIGFMSLTEEVNKLRNHLKGKNPYIVERCENINYMGVLNTSPAFLQNVCYLSHLTFSDVIDVTDKGFKQ